MNRKGRFWNAATGRSQSHSMKFSIVIPARNEEKNIGACLDSIERASGAYPGQVEVIVVLNRCTDGTEAIARSRGAVIARNDSRCLSQIRNEGARHAKGEIIATIDADSRMSANMLSEIDRALMAGKYIGGGVKIMPERWSLGIWVTFCLFRVVVFFTGLGGGLYWCFRRDFEAVGGFKETLRVGEDLDFARRLKNYGRLGGLRFINLDKAHIVTSCRKFDHFGDWLFFRELFFHPIRLSRVLRGQNDSIADVYFYDFKR